jgi:glutaredoxin
MPNSNWSAAPLHWGHGRQVFEVFIEPTCPFSVKAERKLHALLDTVGEDEMTLKVRLHSQPWHLFSAIVTRCVVAASTLENGRDQAWNVLQAIADHREEFVCENHATGANRKAAPDDLIARIENYGGLELAEAFSIPDLDSVIKWHAKYARQNGIHSTPTFMVNGIVQPQLGSGDEITVWADAIRNARCY